MTTPGPTSGVVLSGGGQLSWGDIHGTWQDVMQQYPTWADVRRGTGRVAVALGSATVLTASATVEAAPVTRAQVDEMIGLLQRIVIGQQQANPRWWATSSAVAIYALIGVLIAAAAYIGDRLDALGDGTAADARVATSPAAPDPAVPSEVPGPAPADDWTPDE